VSSPPRFTDVEFPPYSYVPGRFPHPHTDSAGHGFGRDAIPAGPIDPDRWKSCRPYLIGMDLFNHGYYWEAHEAWEQCWHAAGRSGPLAAFFKGLVQLAVVGVKLRQGMPESAAAHARRAAELFQQVREESRASGWMGIDVEALVDKAGRLADLPPEVVADEPAPPKVMLPFVLEPR
jgi:hypothetical protein